MNLKDGLKPSRSGRSSSLMSIRYSQVYSIPGREADKDASVRSLPEASLISLHPSVVEITDRRGSPPIVRRQPVTSVALALK